MVTPRGVCILSLRNGSKCFSTERVSNTGGKPRKVGNHRDHELGGRDLGYPERWDLSLRSDPEGQQVYGPSLANVEIIAVEDDGGSGKRTKHVSALGLTKATNEFLVLHYFAIDSAEAWDEILRVLLPKVRFPDAVVRRSVALKLFHDCHIAPSHRRFPHQLWLDSMCLISDLLVGCGVGRYLGGGFGPAFEQQVALP